MSIAYGVKNRKPLIKQHRDSYLFVAVNRMFDNPTPENGEYLRMRADKVKEFRKC